MKVVGVYKITCTRTEKIYVGMSINIPNRFADHKYNLRNGISTKLLQDAYNKYGESSFKFEVVEIVDNADQLPVKEQYWINKFKATDLNYGMNAEAIAGDRKITLDSRVLNELYIKKGLTQNEIAKLFKVSRIVVKRELIAYGLYVKNKTLWNRRNDILPEKCKELYESGLSTNQIAEKLNTSRQTIFNKLKSIGYEWKVKQRHEKILDMEEVLKLRHQGWSFRKLAEKFNCSDSGIRKKIKKYNTR